MRELNKTQAIILLIVFIAIGGIILYGRNANYNFSPLDYVLKR